MTESFENAMAEMEDKVASDYWVSMARRLKDAHERELEQAKKSEYHRGWTDAMNARNTATWQLDQERREVVRRLRESIDPDYREYPEFFADALIQELGLDVDANFCDVRRRIIHLLGAEIGEEDCAKESCCSCSNGAYKCDKHVCAIAQNDEQHRIASEIRKIEVDTGGFVKSLAKAIGVEWTGHRVMASLAMVRDKLAELIENASISMPSGNTESITAELRDCVETATKQYDDTVWYEMNDSTEAEHTICYITEAELLRAADNIDAEFARILKQQDDAWQAMCEELSAEHEEEVASLKRAAERDADHIDSLTGALEDADAGRDMLCTMLNDAAAEFKVLMEEHKCSCEERDAYMQNYNDVVFGGELVDDAWFEKHGYVKLPTDADGVTIHVGERVYCGEHFGMQEVEGFIHNAVAFTVYDPQPARICTCPASHVSHKWVGPDVAERMVADYTLGRITERQLVERIREAIDGGR